MDHEMIDLTRRPEPAGRAAAWFHDKWDIPQEAYRESMEDSFRGRGSAGSYRCGYEDPGRGSPVPHHRPYLLLRAVWVGVLVHGPAGGGTGPHADVYPPGILS